MEAVAEDHRGVRAMASEKVDEPWYQDGLQFTCTQCGQCCTGEPGYVWVNEEEIRALAKFRKEPEREFVPLYTKKANGKVTLKEKANGDCVFFEAGKGCTVYSVRPRQCRTWPFWESNLKNPDKWEQTEGICPGSGQGELISVEEIVKRMKVIKM